MQYLQITLNNILIIIYFQFILNDDVITPFVAILITRSISIFFPMVIRIQEKVYNLVGRDIQI